MIIGKSTFAKALAVWWALESSKHLEKPRSDARVIWATTLDDLKSVSMAPCWSLVVDELTISDTVSVQYLSEAMCKVLFDPQNAGQLRSRERNSRLAPNVCRIFTSNASSPEDWFGTRIKLSLPIRRKCIFFVIKERLVNTGWASDL